MKKMKNMYRIFPALLSVSVLFTTMPVSATEADTSETITVEIVPSQMDFSLEDELAQTQEILEQFKPGVSTDFYVFENPQMIAAPYIPEGALCTEVAIIGQTVIFDYRIDGVRYIVDYRYDGTVGMTSGFLSSGEVTEAYSVESTSKTIQNTNTDEIDEVWVASEAEIALQMQQALSSDMTAETENTSQIQASTATVKEVNPLFYQNDSDTAPYKAKIVLSGTASLTSLEGTGYSTMQPFRVYETMWYHTQASKTTSAFEIGDRLSKIASLFTVSVSTVRGKSAYNANVNLNGFWSSGVGNGFGY